jgi:hypothetical protein
MTTDLAATIAYAEQVLANPIRDATPDERAEAVRALETGDTAAMLAAYVRYRDRPAAPIA